MKIRNGYVSNSSSSSFVVLKDALTKEQQDMILYYQKWIDLFIEIENQDKERLLKRTENEYSLKDRFEYYNSDPWTIQEYDDFIFGETSMDNFNMNDYFDHIKINDEYVLWEDGYNYEPYPNQVKFINKMKQEYRKKKIDKLNKI